MRARLTAIVLLAAAGLAACGGGSDLSADGAASLGAVVTDLRAAAGAHDAARVRADVQQVRTLVGDLQRHGDISDKRAAAVLASAAEVESAVYVITTTTTTTLLPPGWTIDKHGHYKPPKGKGDHGD